jgi:hypothetical protein
VDVVGLAPLLKANHIPPPYDDFEAIYSDAAADSNKSALQKELEERVYDYFSAFELPDEPTLYDHFILSLRPKDVIATFNWWKVANDSNGLDLYSGGQVALLPVSGAGAMTFSSDATIDAGFSIRLTSASVNTTPISITTVVSGSNLILPALMVSRGVLVLSANALGNQRWGQNCSSCRAEKC